MTPDTSSSLMRGALKHEPRSSTLDVDVVRVLADLDRIEAHSERQRPTEGDDQRDRIRRAAMVLSEYVIQHGGSA